MATFFQAAKAVKVFTEYRRLAVAVALIPQKVRVKPQ